jgi:hypothetical protein
MKTVPRQDWKWFGHAGHLIVGAWCRFHLCTQVGNYLVSTVGEYWPERPVREIHASVHNPKWLEKNKHLRGDAFDHAYMEEFGFEEIGYRRKYETMVFKAGKPCTTKECGCGLPVPTEWTELDSGTYNAAKDATEGHGAMCEKWSMIR